MNDLKALKAKNICEVTWLRFKEIPIVREIQYERKRVFFFANDQLQSTKALEEYYKSDYHKFADLLQDTRNYLFTKLNSESSDQIENSI